MKKILTVFIIALLSKCVSVAQTNDEQIAIYPIVNNTELSKEAQQNLINRLSRAISSYGYGAFSEPERFVLVANVDVTRNDIIPTNPPRVSKSIELTLTIGDVIENKTFASCCIPLAGMGANDTKAYISAISQMSPSNRVIGKMFDEAKLEIIKLYSNSSLFLTKARMFSQQGEYDRAIAYLMTIPSIDNSTAELISKEMVDIYTQKIDSEGLVLYNKACGIWRSTRNLQGAKQVAQILEGINPYASVMSDVDVLWKDIAVQLRTNELAAIEAEKRAHEERMKEADLRAAGVKQLIGAAKAVGIAFGVFQPRMLVTNIIRGWF